MLRLVVETLGEPEPEPEPEPEVQVNPARLGPDDPGAIRCDAALILDTLGWMPQFPPD